MESQVYKRFDPVAAGLDEKFHLLKFSTLKG